MTIIAILGLIGAAAVTGLIGYVIVSTDNGEWSEWLDVAGGTERWR